PLPRYCTNEQACPRKLSSPFGLESRGAVWKKSSVVTYVPATGCWMCDAHPTNSMVGAGVASLQFARSSETTLRTPESGAGYPVNGFCVRCFNIESSSSSFAVMRHEQHSIISWVASNT